LLGAARARLANSIGLYSPLQLQLLDAWDNQQRIDYLEQVEVDVLAQENRLNRGLELLQAQEKAWLSLIRNLETPADKEREERVFDHYINDPLLNYLPVVADELLVAIDREKRVIRRNLARLQGDHPVTPPLQLNPPANHPPPALAYARAPELRRGTFNGDILLWPSYWGVFKASIHDNPNYDDLTRLAYLMGDMVDEAKEATAGFILEVGNYQKLVAFLKERYSDPTAIQREFYHRLDASQPFAKLVNDIQAFARQLEWMQYDLNNLAAMMLVEKALPTWVVREVAKIKIATPVWTWTSCWKPSPCGSSRRKR